MEKTTKVLAIGDSRAVAMDLFDGSPVEIDQTDLLPGKKRTGYDDVVAYLVLQTVPWAQVNNVVSAWSDCLKPGGTLHIFVPSLEWAAEQVLSEKQSDGLIIHLFGPQNAQNAFYKSAFTMMDLRWLLDRAKLKAAAARRGEYFINDIACEMHYVMGVK